MDTRRQLGNKGEQLAARFLVKESYKIIERQWRCRYGEIDLIARDSSGELVFVEVKYRESLRSGYPEESITQMKLLHMQRAAGMYLSQTHQESTPHRFDIIAITQTEDRIDIQHAKGV